ncbi:hypothetical protein ABZ153_23280, partial [Streptomyces sp. NPDC006290]
PGHRDTGTPGHRDTGTPGHRDTGTPGHRDTGERTATASCVVVREVQECGRRDLPPRRRELTAAGRRHGR